MPILKIKLSAQEKETYINNFIMLMLRQAGEAGIDQAQLETRLEANGVTREEVGTVVARMITNGKIEHKQVSVQPELEPK